MLDKVNEYLENTTFIDMETVNIYNDLSIIKLPTTNDESTYALVTSDEVMLLTNTSLPILWEHFKEQYGILTYTLIHDLDEID